MNHYECLKVTPDAPTEVIRAAYRALAGKRHPDRQGGSMGRDDQMHDQMVAINAAYEVLINPDLRVQYDAMLLVAAQANPPGSKGKGNGNGKSVELAEPAPGFSDTRVDIDWMPPKPMGVTPLWPLTRNRKYAALALSLMLLLTVLWMAWGVVVRHQMDKALSDQYTMLPSGRTLDEDQLAGLTEADPEALAAPPASVPARRPQAAMTPEEALAEEQGLPPTRPQAPPPSFDRPPTVTELSRLSDEQLMAILPSLGELQPAKGSFSRQAVPHHPLDGKPLNLRQDRQLVDPLALDMLKH